MPICAIYKGKKWFSIANKDSCHAPGTQCLNLPTSLYFTLFASAKSVFKMDCAN